MLFLNEPVAKQQPFVCEDAADAVMFSWVRARVLCGQAALLADAVSSAPFDEALTAYLEVARTLEFVVMTVPAGEDRRFASLVQHVSATHQRARDVVVDRILSHGLPGVRERQPGEGGHLVVVDLNRLTPWLASMLVVSGGEMRFDRGVGVFRADDLAAREATRLPGVVSLGYCRGDRTTVPLATRVADLIADEGLDPHDALRVAKRAERGPFAQLAFPPQRAMPSGGDVEPRELVAHTEDASDETVPAEDTGASRVPVLLTAGGRRSGSEPAPRTQPSADRLLAGLRALGGQFGSVLRRRAAR